MAPSPKAQDSRTDLKTAGFNKRGSECPTTPLTPTLEELSLCYFMTTFIYTCPEDVFEGHLDFLPGLYRDGRKQCQDLAIMSVAYLAAFNKWRSCALFKESRKYYGAALRSLQNSLRSPKLALCDNTFAAALVLALFVVSQLLFV
jgi:hypothetical protein